MANRATGINRSQSAIIVVDVQEKLVKAIVKKEILIENIRFLIQMADILQIRKYFTEQSPEKIGFTISPLANRAKDSIHPKMSFSLMSDECSSMISELRDNNSNNIILCGLETHICIKQSCLDLMRNGFNVYIVADAVGSRFDYDHQLSLEEMRSNGAQITTFESLAYELLKTAADQNFKEISNLVKSRAKILLENN